MGVIRKRHFVQRDVPTDMQRFGQGIFDSISKVMPQTMDFTEVAFLASQTSGTDFKPYVSVFRVSDKAKQTDDESVETLKGGDEEEARGPQNDPIMAESIV